MSGLLNEIKTYNANAARTLERADFRTDSEIQSLTRGDLHELFPGSEKLKLRREIFDIINKQKPIEKILKELRNFLPDDSIKDALTSNGVLVDYLHLMKDMKAQLNNVQSFLEAHIHLLEGIKAQPEQKHDTGSAAKALVGPTSSCFVPNDTTSKKSQVQVNQSVGVSRSTSFHSYGRSQVAQVTVNYNMVISGRTFDAHHQILSQVKSSAQQLNLVESQSSEDCQIVLVFCPIVSRTGTDVEAAMKMVTGAKPAILVLMHHAYEPKHVATMGTWDYNPKIVQHFSVFYHERVNGLIRCKENNDAISGIQQELLKHGVHTETREYPASEKKGSGFFDYFYPR
ncbi:uncharacterized protein LOC111611343 [Xiphophorus maculatus]|uniref:uncharacterized protein LOC111611343 n=1 Tax=Xiphophorus maculatus TaxID=8083 RepID=UPI000C6C95E8|nr:uncharacterized protein LOC111611343 [Xiphophorus maculatus]XP_023203135.1 uncharacterized protein LOC111611343 [Xiphophorus maculatus]